MQIYRGQADNAIATIVASDMAQALRVLVRLFPSAQEYRAERIGRF